MCTVPVLKANSIRKCDKWSDGRRNLYSPEFITRCFEYYACSRTLYSRLLQDFQLPSIRSLQMMTSKCSKLDDNKLINLVFNQIDPIQKKSVVMIDEMYVKACLSYHGGTVFGKAVDDANKLAKTILAIMVKCCFEGPEFLFKTLPVSNLSSKFLKDTSDSSVNAIEEAGGEVLAIVTDGYRVNQPFFNQIRESNEKPWKKKYSGTYLLFDYACSFIEEHKE